MKNDAKDKEFEEIYTDIHRKYQYKMEEWTKAVKLSKTLYLGLAIFLLVVLLVMFATPLKEVLAANQGTFAATIIAIIIVAIIVIAFASSLKNKYKKEYKETIVTDLVNRTNSNFKFTITIK